MAGLELQHIEKTFGRSRVLHDVSFEVGDGEFIVLLGPSGCGKSTLLRIIAGLEPQTRGSVFFGGQCVDDLSPPDRDVAMVFQHYALYPHLTVRENLAFGLKMRRDPKPMIEARIAETAALLEIHDLLDRKPRELSGGQQQRVAMGRAIVRKPKLFLFDEPLSNLDARLRASMRVELKKLHQRLGTTMVYVTHDQAEAMTLGHTIVVMNHGRIQQIGRPEQIYHEPANPFVAGFIGNPPMNLFEGSFSLDQRQLEFRVGDLTLRFPFQAHELIGADNGMATLGVRPEDVTFEPQGSGHVAITGTIDLIENLGHDSIMHMMVKGQSLMARTSSSLRQHAGESITIHVKNFHLFINERRIPLQSP
ncbi:MAG: sn-glycerol-3-phosphate ABC transporter ATP-binding protein UgpC [Nitrospira sp. SB0662_bin_26]|nr:sn-glycerol-3-phosphate ABC transporter ATP-binding protein UgpC [Nitrospira sp. SB0662_bin_26]